MEDPDYWKVIFFQNDKSFCVIKRKSVENKVIFGESFSVSVKFGATWYSGKIVGGGSTKKEADNKVLQLQANELEEAEEMDNDQGKTICV